jgi:Carboxypeptidase regulatory-like domain
MFQMRTHKTVSSLVAGLVCLAVPQPSQTASLSKLPGSLGGVVRSSIGTPQAGAAVQLYNRQERVILRAVTDERGQFTFADLIPDVYAVRVTRLPFDPASRPGIAVHAGERTVLTVSLSSLFSSIQISYPTIENGLMSDEWKWVLRSAPSTRPVFRFNPEAMPSGNDTEALAQEGQRIQRAAMFSETRGIVRVSAGDRAISAGIGTEADLGTTFALATAVYGSSLLQVSGNLGYGAQTGTPAAAFRTSYSRSLLGTTPEVSLTMRQMLLPGRVAAALAGQDGALPTLRTMSASFDDHLQLSDQLTLQYGSTLDYVSFLDRLNYISPYARLSYRVSDGGELEFAFTSGNARPDLGSGENEDAELQRGLDTLSLFPRVSLMGGQTKVQRGEEYEAGYSQKVGSRTYHLSAYRESIYNAALSMVGASGTFSGTDLMPDLFSGNSIFNAGNFHSAGYSASVTQDLGQNVNASLTYGSTGALTTTGHELISSSPDDLRAMIRAGRRNSATIRVAATLPYTGTRFTASYQWSGNQRWAMAGNIYSTQPLHPMPGFNIFIRQPIPGLSKRVEATAELRNMLAQGYLPLYTADGQRILLVETPRSFRGGLSFIF